MAEKRITRHDATPETREAWATIDAAAARAPRTAQESKERERLAQFCAPPEEEIAAAWQKWRAGVWAKFSLSRQQEYPDRPAAFWEGYLAAISDAEHHVRALLSGTGSTEEARRDDTG